MGFGAAIVSRISALCSANRIVSRDVRRLHQVQNDGIVSRHDRDKILINDWEETPICNFASIRLFGGHDNGQGRWDYEA